MSAPAKEPTTFIVMDKAARMPSSCRYGPYRRVAVVEVEAAYAYVEPKMISERARGVVRIVETWERLYAGKTERCAFERAYAEATRLADQLNDDFRALRKLLDDLATRTILV